MNFDKIEKKVMKLFTFNFSFTDFEEKFPKDSSRERKNWRGTT